MRTFDPVPPFSAPADQEQLTRYWQSLASWKPYSDPLPADIDTAVLDAVEAAVSAQMRPANNAEVISAIKRLRMHYGEWSQLTEAEEADVWRDWCLDFKAYPKALLDEACALWRNSKEKRPPTSGQLKDKVRRDLERLRHIGWQASKARTATADIERMWRS